MFVSISGPRSLSQSASHPVFISINLPVKFFLLLTTQSGSLLIYFFLTLPHPHGLKSHSDAKGKEEKEEAVEKYGTADAIIQTHTRIVEKLHRIHARQS